MSTPVIIVSVWTESYIDEETDDLQTIYAHIANSDEKSTMIIDTYDPDQFELDLSVFEGMTIRKARNYIRKKKEKYRELQNLLENPGGFTHGWF